MEEQNTGGQTFYKGKFKSLEDLERAYEEAERKITELAERNKEYEAYLEALLEGEEDEYGDEYGGYGEEAYEPDIYQDSQQYQDMGGQMTPQMIQQLLLQALQPYLEPLQRNAVAGNVKGTLTAFLASNPQFKPYEKEIANGLQELALSGIDISDPDILEEVAIIAKHRLDKSSKEMTGGNVEGEEEASPPAIDFGGRSGGKKERTKPSLSPKERLVAKNMGIDEKDFLEEKMKLEEEQKEAEEGGETNV